jgi:hypothetical protein
MFASELRPPRGEAQPLRGDFEPRRSGPRLDELILADSGASRDVSPTRWRVPAPSRDRKPAFDRT